MPLPFLRPVLVLLLLVSLVGSGCLDPSRPNEATEADLPQARPGWVDEAVIYEVFVRDFTPEGTFRAMIPRLDELKALGVNTLWLMPIHPIGAERRKGTLGSPYSVRDFYAVNPDFGTEDDFRALVDAVHERDMYVIIDLVANHTAWDNAWLTAHPEWYTRDDDGNVVPPVDDWYDVADLDYDNPEVRAEMANVMRYWVEQFDIDGYRCDVAGMVPADFWKTAIASVREIKPVLMLAEAGEPEMHRIGFDVTYGWDLYHGLKAVWKGESAGRVFDILGEEQEAFPPGALRLRFTTNHDETAWDETPVALFGGPQGARAAAVVAATLPGVPLVYNGQEVGSTQRLGLFEKEAIRWQGGQDMREFYRRLLEFYGRSPALLGGSVEPLAREADDVLLYTRRAGGARVVVAVNVRDEAQTLAMPRALRGAAARGVFAGDALVLPDTLALEPYGYRVWSLDAPKP